MVSGVIEMMADHLALLRPVLITGRRSNTGEGIVKVRRALFGPRTPGESGEFIRKEAEALLESDCRKWNFDFKIETPFTPAENQKWQWTKVEERLSDKDCNNLITGDRKIQCSVVSSANTRLNQNSNVSYVAVENETRAKPESFTAIRNKQYQQTTMHDYMKARKRNMSSASKLDVSTTTSELSSSEAPTKIRKMASSK